MKTKVLFLWILLAPLLHGQTSKELLRDGLFAEESEGDLKTATEKYEALLKAFEAERKVAAVALFRLAAVKRKQGEDKAALALYEEFAKKFTNVEPQATLVRENYLAISGKEFPNAVDGFDEEDQELAKIKKLELTSPDLFPNLDQFKDYVSAGQKKIVTYLLKKGADPNHQGALALATQKGNLSMVTQLLDAGADPNHENNISAFGEAVEKGHWQIAELLGKNQARIDLNQPAILSENSTIDLPQERLQFLIDHGADPNHIQQPWFHDKYRNPIGIPILDAVRLKNHDYAKFLLKSGAKVDLCRSHSGVRAIHLACKSVDEQMIKLLIEAGANLDSPVGPLQDRTDNLSFPSRYSRIGISSGQRPLDLMSLEDGKILVEAGAKLPADILFRAIDSKKTEMVDYFLKKGADLNQQIESRNTRDQLPLNRAFSNNDDNMVKHLLQKGADLSKAARHLLPLKYRIQSARESRYEELSNSGKVTLIFPEVSHLESVTFTADFGDNLPANLLALSIPKSFYASNNNGPGTTYQVDYDRMTWNLVRAGKVKPFDLAVQDLPNFRQGDIIEVLGFGENSRHLDSGNVRKEELAKIPSKISTQLLQTTRFPIKITRDDWTHEYLVCPDKVTFDARNNIHLPSGSLGQILNLILTGSATGLEQMMPLDVKIERSDFPEFKFLSNTAAIRGFELKEGDHITLPNSPKWDIQKPDDPFTEVPTALNDRLQSVTARLPGTLGGWRWQMIPLESGENASPSLLAIIAEINAGYKFENSPTDVSAFNKLQSQDFRKVLPGIDLSQIVIHRWNKEEGSEEKIELNLSKKIAEWLSGEKSQRPFDFRLQGGDLIDLKVKIGDWRGFPNDTNDYFETALNFPLILVDYQSTKSLELNFEMPSWHQFDWGYFPFAKKDTISSIRGDRFLPTSASLQRGETSFHANSTANYWPQAGDVIDINTNRRRGPTAPPTPGVRYVPAPGRNSTQTKTWPPVEGVKKADKPKPATPAKRKRERYVPRPK